MSSTLQTTDDYQRLFLEDIPLIDLRAPVEFAQGGFPHAGNLPLMGDDERAEVGTCYKRQGQDAAIVLGHQLVSGDLKAQRMQSWWDFIREHPNGALYCFRGGLRSRTTQQWIFDEYGIDYPRVTGGYKALRRFLLESIERLSASLNIVILAGRSGTGKTRLLTQLDNSIDLEGLANHRGSAFGNTTTPQPTQIDFENALAVALLKAEAAAYPQVVLEDESRNIGSLHLPVCLHEAMSAAPMVVLDVDDAERIAITVQEYAEDMHREWLQQLAPDAAFAALEQHLLTSLSKVKRRLGGVRYAESLEVKQSALQTLKATGSCQGFEAIFGELLLNYYDPMYDYQMQQKRERIAFSGTREQVTEYLKRA